MLTTDQSFMETIWPYLVNLHVGLEGHPAWTSTILVATSVVSGMIVGLERERKDKPAGMRTVALICTGSTIFTLASVHAGGVFRADPSRIAAQIVTGIGFLGAGAIIRERGRVIGMTTGATVWAVAAIGVLIGMGFAAAGLLLSLVVVAILTLSHHLEKALLNPCQLKHCRIIFDADGGKTRVRIRRLLDAFEVSPGNWTFKREGDRETLELHYCATHPQHRIYLGKLAGMKQVREIQDP
jgi:putative Mg2+ transporter-C (MgtC) family protein